MTGKNMRGKPSFVFSCDAVVEETFIRALCSLFKAFAGIDTTQMNSYSMFQTMPTTLYTRWNPAGFKCDRKTISDFKKMLTPYFYRLISDFRIQSYHSTGRERKTDS